MPPTTFGNLMLTLGGMQTLAFLVLGSGYSTRWHYRFAPYIDRSGVGGCQFSRNMENPTHDPLGIRVRRYRCVCRFHLF